MSKSKGNVIDPDDHVKTVGADTVKMYLAFMGPYEGANYPFDLGGIAGVRRFLERVYGLVEHLTEETPTPTCRQLHKTIAKVRGDIESFKFNTAISAMMIFVNQAEKTGLTKADYEIFLRLLAPFAPHLTEEIWSTLGYTKSIHSVMFPEPVTEFLVDETVTLAVQINGKMRGTITVAQAASEAQVLEIAKQNNDILKHIGSLPIQKVIYVPGRILNLILSPKSDSPGI